MKKLFLMKNPELFQGEKNIKTNNNYFEGWYFKNTNNENGIHIDIKDDAQNLKVYGDIRYSNGRNIGTNLLNPNIMGPFSYIPFMECNHAILNMKNRVDGFIDINNSKIMFNDGVGYIEKDWGCSFPKSYMWCQGNNFQNSNASFMISIADVPFKAFHFKGIICDLIIDNNEYKFTTYNNAKLMKYDVEANCLDIVLKKENYYLNVRSKCTEGLKLFAPVKGKMEKDIFESIASSIIVTLKKDDTVIFSDTSINCRLEIVEE